MRSNYALVAVLSLAVLGIGYLIYDGRRPPEPVQVTVTDEVLITPTRERLDGMDARLTAVDQTLANLQAAVQKANGTEEELIGLQVEQADMRSLLTRLMESVEETRSQMRKEAARFTAVQAEVEGIDKRVQERPAYDEYGVTQCCEACEQMRAEIAAMKTDLANLRGIVEQHHSETLQRLQSTASSGYGSNGGSVAGYGSNGGTQYASNWQQAVYTRPAAYQQPVYQQPAYQQPVMIDPMPMATSQCVQMPDGSWDCSGGVSGVSRTMTRQSVRSGGFLGRIFRR